MLHRVGCQIDEFGAVIDGADMHAGREQGAMVQLGDLLLQALQGRHALLVFLQEHDRFNDIVLPVSPDFSEAGLEAFLHLSDITYKNGSTVLLRDHHVSDIVDVSEQSDGTYVDVLVADGEIVSARVGVAVLYGRDQLRQGDSIGEELVRVRFYLVLLGRASEGCDVDHSGYLLEFSTDQPVLRRFQIVERVWAGELISVYLSRRRPWRELRLQIIWQLQGLQTGQYLLTVVEKVAREFEIEFDVAEAEDADGTDLVQLWSSVQSQLDWRCNLLLDLFCGPCRILRNDLHQWRRRVGVGLDVELQSTECACSQRGDKHDQHDGAVAKKDVDERSHFQSATGSRRNAAPSVTIRSPSRRPETISIWFPW